MGVTNGDGGGPDRYIPDGGMNNGFMNGGVGGPPRQHPQPPPHAMQPPMPSSHLSPPPQHMMQAPPEPSYAAAERASKMRDYEVLCQIVSQWNANRLDLFALTLPNEVRV